jgi:hypothetical protein
VIGLTLCVILVVVGLVLDLVRGEYGLSGDLLVLLEFLEYWILLTAAVQLALWMATFSRNLFSRIQRLGTRL